MVVPKRKGDDMNNEELIRICGNRLTKDLSVKIEQYIKLHIKPKPKSIPRVLWMFILRHVLVLYKFKGIV